MTTFSYFVTEVQVEVAERLIKVRLRGGIDAAEWSKGSPESIRASSA